MQGFRVAALTDDDLCGSTADRTPVRDGQFSYFLVYLNDLRDNLVRLDDTDDRSFSSDAGKSSQMLPAASPPP